jgi:hypothetical protein
MLFMNLAIPERLCQTWKATGTKTGTRRGIAYRGEQD